MWQWLNSTLIAILYDPLMQRIERQGLNQWRRELLKGVKGRVLELGSGTGSNLPCYPQADLELLLCEPDRQMRRQLKKKLTNRQLPRAEVFPWPAEKIEQPANSIDVIVSTLVLCSVNDLRASLKEVQRLLKPGGILLFLEHVEARETSTRGWQRRLEPAWSSCGGNCHLTRDPVTVMSEVGLELTHLIEADLPGAPAIVRRTMRGQAIKPLNGETTS